MSHHVKTLYLYTLALRHQFKVLHRFISKKGFKNSVEFGSEIIPIDTMVGNSQSLDRILKNINEHSIFVSWIKYNGIKYQPGISIQICRDKFGEPVFGYIHYIIWTADEDIYFIYSKIDLIGINKHIQGYLVDVHTESISFDIIALKDIYCIFPAVIHRIGTGEKAINIMNQD